MYVSGVEIWCMWIFLNCWRNLFGQLKMIYNNLYHSVCIKFYFPSCLSMLHDNDLSCSVILTIWLFFIQTVKWCYKLCYSATNQSLSKFQQIERVLPLKWCCSKIIFHGRFFLKMYNRFPSLRPSNFLCLMK